MNDKLHIADADLSLYAMGALAPEEMEQARVHLLGCALCREELRQNTLVLGAYAQTTPESAMPEGARERFMARVAQTPQVETDEARSAQAAVPVQTAVASGRPLQAKPSIWSSLFGSGGWSLALAGAMAVLLVAAGIDDAHKRAEVDALQGLVQRGAADTAQLNELMDLLTSSQAKRVSLRPGPVTTPPPDGRVVYAARSGKLLLTASNLHPLPAGKVYELWILQPGGKKPLPAGTFSPDATGNATMILADAPPDLSVQGFGVTVENAGGAQTPTLPIVLSGF